MSLDRKTASKTLRDLSALLEVQGENVHRVRALANASRIVERIEGDLEELVESGEILKTRGIGEGTAAILEQLVAGERPDAMEKAERMVPEGVRAMLALPGLGPKKVRALWQDLGLENIGELEYACTENRLVELPGFGPTTQEKLIDAIRFHRASGERRLINEASAEASELAGALGGIDGVQQVLVAGELRRSLETVGSLELVVVTSAGAAVGTAIANLLDQGGPETSGRYRGVTGSGLPVTVHMVGEGDAGSALLRATGSDEHLRTLGERAKTTGFRLDEKGLWRGQDRIECSSEHDLYEAIDCQWIPPELREGTDELGRALSRDLPELVAAEDLLGALHNHTTDSDGSASVESMAEAARERGWEFIGIADHSPAATYANGLSAERLRDQWRRIDRFNASNAGVRIVKGIEADILTDGTLDIPEGCQEDLEYVVASVHSAFRLAEDVQTERIVRAVSHPACKVLGHPTGRLLLARPGYAVDLERVLEACAEHGVAVEINASPYRLDLDWRWARRALEFDLKLAVNPDAHTVASLDDVQWGIAVARKAGATKGDLVNCGDVEGFLSGS